MEIKLDHTYRATETKGCRLRKRPVQWTDKAVAFRAYKEVGFQLDFTCKRIERFFFDEEDFARIVTKMISILPLAVLLEINKVIATRISLLASKNAEELGDKTEAAEVAGKNLSQCRNELSKAQRENLSLKLQLGTRSKTKKHIG